MGAPLPEQQQQRRQFSNIASNVLISGIGVSCGTTVTNPIDVIKTRLQLQPASSGNAPGMLSTGVGIVRHEGVLRLWAGWRPAVARAMAYGGLRLGLYGPMKNLIASMQQQGSSLDSSAADSSSNQLQQQRQQQIQQADSSSSSLPAAAQGDTIQANSTVSSTTNLQADAGQALVQPSSSSTNTIASSSSTTAGSSSSSNQVPGSSGSVSVKVLAGIASGAIAAALLSPTELVKVRLQQPGSPYRSSMQVVSAVVKADGMRGLWKGATPGVVRAAALTASQCATYDEVKARVMAATQWPDNAATHLATALITGIVSTTATNPVDVVKTFMFVGGSRYRNPWRCAAAIYATHGLSGFWRGWLANYARLGPQTVMTFLVVEQLRHLAGMEPL